MGNPTIRTEYGVVIVKSRDVAGPFRSNQTIGELEKYCFHYVCSFSTVA